MPGREHRKHWPLVSGSVLGLLGIVGGRLVLPRFTSDLGLFSLSVVGVLLVSGALLSEALGVSTAVVELVLGTLAGMAGVPRTEVVDVLGLVGSVYIMYMAGLEVDTRLLRRTFARSLAAGMASFIGPLVVAYAGLRAFGFPPLESLLAGIATSTTSVAVVYSIIRGSMRRPLGQIVLATAMVADVASIVAFVMVSAGPGTRVLAYIAASFAGALVVARFVESVAGGSYEIEVRVLTAVLVAAALLGEYAGMHAILFAFLLGAATRRTVGRVPGLVDRLESISFGLMAPIFFIDAGLHAAPERLTLYLELSLLLLALTLPAKVLSTYSALRLVVPRIPWRAAVVFGARLTVSTVIAFEGEATGVLSHDVAGAIIFSALIATVVSASLAGAGLGSEEV